MENFSLMFEDLFTVEHVCNVLHMENHECVHLNQAHCKA